VQPVVVMKRPHDDVADHPELCSDHARNRFSSAFMRGIHRRLLSKAIEHNEDNRHDFVGTQLSSTATLSATATPDEIHGLRTCHTLGRRAVCLKDHRKRNCCNPNSDDLQHSPKTLQCALSSNIQVLRHQRA